MHNVPIFAMARVVTEYPGVYAWTSGVAPNSSAVQWLNGDVTGEGRPCNDVMLTLNGVSLGLSWTLTIFGLTTQKLSKVKSTENKFYGQRDKVSESKSFE